MKLSSHHRTWLIALLAMDGLFFGLTGPDKVPSFMLIVGFVLLALNLYYLFRGLIAIGRWYGLPAGKHRFRLAKVLTGLVSGLAALQSIGELSSRDILVLLPLALLTYLYFAYRPAAEKVQTTN